jgi:hypothetical protein
MTKRYRFSSGDEEKSKKAEQQFLRITENMTDEERDAVLKMMIKMQKQMFFQEPWLLKRFTGKEQAHILAQYTREEQLIMLARFDLELQHWKDKKRNS